MVGVAIYRMLKTTVSYEIRPFQIPEKQLNQVFTFQVHSVERLGMKIAYKPSTSERAADMI